MLDKKTWNEFRDSGLLWWVNRILHTFRWVLVVEYDDHGEVSSVFPARCSPEICGFDEETDDKRLLDFREMARKL